jgi:hypothetical protein
LLQSEFAGEISQHHSQEDGQDALAGKHQHGDAEHDEHERKNIFRETKRNANCRGLSIQLAWPLEI